MVTTAASAVVRRKMKTIGSPVCVCVSDNMDVHTQAKHTCANTTRVLHSFFWSLHHHHHHRVRRL